MSDPDAQPRSLRSEAFHNKPRANTRWSSPRPSSRLRMHPTLWLALGRSCLNMDSALSQPVAPGMPEGWQQRMLTHLPVRVSSMTVWALGCRRDASSRARLLALTGFEICASRRVTERHIGTNHRVFHWREVFVSVMNAIVWSTMLGFAWNGRVWRIEPMPSLQPYQSRLVVQIAFVFVLQVAGQISATLQVSHSYSQSLAQPTPTPPAME